VIISANQTDLGRWRKARDAICRRIMDRGGSPRLTAFVQHDGAGVLDAAVLMMPLVKFISPAGPRWLSILDALTASLVSDSLVCRYDPQAIDASAILDRLEPLTRESTVLHGNSGRLGLCYWRGRGSGSRRRSSG